MFSFKLGVENISFSLIKKICNTNQKKYKVGLITNQTGVDQLGKRTIEILQNNGCTVEVIFTPEHGLTGIAAGENVDNSVDELTGIPIIGLYRNGSGKTDTFASYAHTIDILFFDIADSGMRHYTYISTLLQSMERAVEYNKHFVVLDRPNPLGGFMQGPCVEDDLFSFISIASIPLRHGMTIGEIAWYFNKYVLKKPAQLHVVTMSNYDRSNGFSNDLLYQLSPNLRSLQSCYGYSFLGLLGEIDPFDVGIGTEMAFRCITISESRDIAESVWEKLQKVLAIYDIKTYPYRYMNTKKNMYSRGLRLEFVTNKIRSFDVLLDILDCFKNTEVPLICSKTFDKAIGTKKIQALMTKTYSRKQLCDEICSDLINFQRKAKYCFLYQPFPFL